MPAVGEGDVLTLRAPAEGERRIVRWVKVRPRCTALSADRMFACPSQRLNDVGLAGGVYHDGEALAGMSLDASGALELHLETDEEVLAQRGPCRNGPAWTLSAPRPSPTVRRS